MTAIDVATRNRHYRCLEYDHHQEGDLTLIACGVDQCDRGVAYGPDVREGCHLHVVLSGEGMLRAGGKTMRPRFGQMFLLKDGEAATYAADARDPWSYCWVTYGGTRAREVSEQIGFTDGVYCLDSSLNASYFYELVCRMHEKPQMNRIGDLRRRGILLEFLSLAMEATQEFITKRTSPKAEYPKNVYVERAVDFIHYNYETITVMDIVEYVGFTRSYFSTMFKKQMGVSPQDYLKQYRLRKGSELIRSTDLPMQEIAQKIGYEDPLNFSRAFKGAFGVSPTEYRRAAQS